MKAENEEGPFTLDKWLPMTCGVANIESTMSLMDVGVHVIV